MRAMLSSDRRVDRLPSHPLRYAEGLSEPAATFMDSLAVDEARAILAETEQSDPWHPAIYGHGGSSERIGCAVTEAEDALADALRSFVGEPCHCAQGLHWSPGRGYFHCAGVTPEA